MKKISSFGERLREAMKLRNLEAKDLELKTGIAASQIYRYAKNINLPKSDKIHTLSKVLEVNEIWLLGYDAHFEVNTPQKIKLRKDIDNILNEADTETLNKVLLFLTTFIRDSNE